MTVPSGIVRTLKEISAQIEIGSRKLGVNSAKRLQGGPAWVECRPPAGLQFPQGCWVGFRCNAELAKEQWPRSRQSREHSGVPEDMTAYGNRLDY